MNKRPSPERMPKSPEHYVCGRIVLKSINSLWFFRPEVLPDAPFEPCSKIPENLVRRGCSWLAAIWQYYKRVGCVLFYWSATKREWVIDVPPQSVSEHEFRCDLAYTGFLSPDRNHLLAGSLTSVSTPELDADHAPGFDGFHLLQDIAREFDVLTAFARAHSEPMAVPVRSVVDRWVDPQWAHWTQRVRLTEAL